MNKRFTQIVRLGDGVFKAIDHSNQALVVLKYGDRKQLLREQHCIAQCNSPYIIANVEYLSQYKTLVMPYLEGKNLLNFTHAEQHVFIDIIPQIVRAIAHLHSKGWVHGDIKPSNIIYEHAAGTIKIIDFGAALPTNTPLVTLSHWQLTRDFSRESKQKGIGNIGPQDDWFSVKQLLGQIDGSLLTKQENNHIKRWSAWLEERIKQ